MKRQLYLRPYRSRSRVSRKKVGVICFLVLGGLGAFWWLARPSRVLNNSVSKTPSEALHDVGLPSVRSLTNQGAAPAGEAASRTALPAPISRPASVTDSTKMIPSLSTLRAFPESAEALTNGFPRPVRDIAEAQIALARLGLSSGSVDGRLGPQTALALEAYQRIHHLLVTGRLDSSTLEALQLTRAPYTNYVVTEADLKRLQPLSKTWTGKAAQTALDYETILELVAERTRAAPQFLRRLNPREVFLAPAAGASIIVPDTDLGALTPCAFLRVALVSRTLEVFDEQSNLMAHFPCSIAQRVEKRPAGELHVASIAPNPNYTFDPVLFPESPEAAEPGRKLILPPGPNNPVGIAWIGLDKPGYGIHGTPSPEQVGRTESHGCFRLTNWNAEHLLKIVRIGTPVYVE